MAASQPSVEARNTMPIRAVADNGPLSIETIRATLEQALSGRFTGQKLLVLIPDHTRSLPLPLLFQHVVELLADTSRLDFMVALGTHPPLTPDSLNSLLGIDESERHSR